MLKIIVLIFFSFACFADESKTISIKEAINLALANNLEIKTEEYKKNIALTDLDLIKGETSTKINTTLGVGPINGKKGNYLGYSNENTWGAEWIASIEAKIPLYLWGREDNLKTAASLNGDINQLDVTKKQNEIIFKVKEAYYGLQYALSLLDFVKETENDLADAIKIIEEKKGKKEDLLRLEVFRYQVEEKRIEVEKSVRIATMGLGFYIGLKEYKIEREWIEFEERELKSLDSYNDLLLNNYPDLKKVSKGIVAKTNLLENEKKSNLPTFGAILKYDYAQTNQRTAQNNPFIVDPYNHSDVAVGVGLTWDLDFGVKKSKADKLNFEIMELKSKEHFAKSGLSTLLTKAYYELEANEKKSRALAKAYKSSKKWLSNIQTSVGLGLSPAKDIIDAYTTRALVYKDYYESIYNHHLAWGHLSEAVGIEVDPLLN
jgi:outer membrane protein TolC